MQRNASVSGTPRLRVQTSGAFRLRRRGGYGRIERNAAEGSGGRVLEKLEERRREFLVGEYREETLPAFVQRGLRRIRRCHGELQLLNSSSSSSSPSSSSSSSSSSLLLAGQEREEVA